MESDAEKLEIFRSEPVPKAVMHNALPAMAAILFRETVRISQEAGE